MNDYVNAGGYVAMGFIGALVHYLKKRYIDNTTKVNLIVYLGGEIRYTLNTIGNLVWAEVVLANSSGNIMELSNVIGALTLGYFCDSVGNKAPENK